MPQGVKDMLSAAGVLDEVPWEGEPPPEPSDFIRPPPPTFDWTDPHIDPDLPENAELGMVCSHSIAFSSICGSAAENAVGAQLWHPLENPRFAAVT